MSDLDVLDKEESLEEVFGNVVHREELSEHLYYALSDLEDILAQHAGPFATNCVIGSRWRQANDIDEFTKDGIKILRHMVVSDDSSQRFAARMARFVGIAVDKRCHDGTTTSMLLFCRLAKVAIKYMDSGLTDRSRFRWWHAFLSAVETCLQKLEDLKITEQDFLDKAKELGIETDLAKVRAAIAFHMAMISSKGDFDLSTKVATLIGKSPKKIYGMFKETTLAVETSEAYTLKKQDYDLSLYAMIGSVEDYNYMNDTQYLAEDAVVFATGNEIVTSSWESMFLTAFLSTSPRVRNDLKPFFGADHGWEEFHQGRRNLVIITPLMQDTKLFETIIEFNKKNPTCKITVFNAQIQGRMRTSFNKTLHYMAGVPLFTDSMENATASLIGLNGKGARVHYLGGTLTLSDLYEKDGETYHPLYRDPEAFPPYTKFRQETEEMITFAQENITNPGLDHDEVTYLITLYRALTCQEIYDIEVGGSTHDQRANSTVYEDTVGAALAAVNDGVILGGYAHLAAMADSFATFAPVPEIYRKEQEAEAKTVEANKHYWSLFGILFFVGAFISTIFKWWFNLGAEPEKTEETKPAFDTNMVWDDFRDVFLSILSDSMRAEDKDELYLKVDSDLPDKWSYIAADPQNYLYGYEGEDQEYIFSQHFTRETMEEFLACKNNSPILLQAWSGYHEQFMRIKAILPKLANTTQLADMRMKNGDDVR